MDDFKTNTKEHVTDVFTRWIVGIAGVAVVAIGAGMLSTLTELRQDLTIVKTNTAQLSTNLIDHEQRLRQIERDWKDHASEAKECYCPSHGTARRPGVSR